MKLACMSDNLRVALTDAARVVSKRSTLPVLGNVCLRTKDAGLTIEATNLDAAFRVFVPGRVIEDGATTVNAAAFLAAAKAEPKATLLAIEAQGANLTLTGGATTTFETLDADEFPKLSIVTGEPAFNVEDCTLREGLASVVHAAASDQSRPVLASVSVRVVKGRVVLVTADNYRIAERTIDVHNAGDAAFLVPIENAKLLLRLLASADAHDAVDVTVSPINGGKGHAVFAFGSATFVSRLIDGMYPNYEQVLPVKSTTSFVVDRLALLGAVKSAGQVAKSAADIIRLEVGDDITVRAKGDRSDYARTIPAAVEGDAMTIALNWSYLVDLASILPDPTLLVGLTGALAPLSVTARDFRAAVMPVRTTS